MPSLAANITSPGELDPALEVRLHRVRVAGDQAQELDPVDRDRQPRIGTAAALDHPATAVVELQLVDVDAAVGAAGDAPPDRRLDARGLAWDRSAWASARRSRRGSPCAPASASPARAARATSRAPAGRPRRPAEPGASLASRLTASNARCGSKPNSFTGLDGTRWPRVACSCLTRRSAARARPGPAARLPSRARGRLAQLVERLPYKQEVTGSSPVPPTARRKWYFRRALDRRRRGLAEPESSAARIGYVAERKRRRIPPLCCWSRLTALIRTRISPISTIAIATASA